MIQVDFCNREQTVKGNKTWPWGEGAFSRDFTNVLSPQRGAFSRALKTEKLKAPLFLGLQMISANKHTPFIQ